MPPKASDKASRNRRKQNKAAAVKSNTVADAIAIAAETAAKNAPELPKDAEELELEKLVFGDVAGFQDGLKVWDVPAGEIGSDEEDNEGDMEMLDAPEGDKGQELADMNDDQLFFVDDTVGAPDTDMVLHTGGEGEGMELVKAEKVVEPAWVDSDDERMVVSLANRSRTRKLRNTEEDDVVTGREYAERLRRQFERIYPTPEWAQSEKPAKRRRRDSDSESSDEDDEGAPDFTVSAPSLTALLSSTVALTKKKTALKLRPEVLDIHRLPDANIDAASKSGIKSISFHPTHPLLLTSGFDSTLRLYHIDNLTNPLATSLHIRNSPLTTSLFLGPVGNRIICAGRRRYFHVWNLQTGAVDRITNIYGHRDVQRSMEAISASPDGRYISLIGSRGTVQFLDAETCQWIDTATIEGVVTDISWVPGPTSDLITIANKNGELYEYSLSARKIMSVWNDEGGVNTTVIAQSHRFVVVGSASGVVNIYDRQISWSGKRGKMGAPKPVKTIESIVTSISVLRFSPDGQVLAVASSAKKDSLRLIHLPTCTLYKNWPTQQTPLGKVTAVEWVVKGGESGGLLLAVGNESGKVRMFEVRG